MSAVLSQRPTLHSANALRPILSVPGRKKAEPPRKKTLEDELAALQRSWQDVIDQMCGMNPFVVAIVSTFDDGVRTALQWISYDCVLSGATMRTPHDDA